MKIKETILITLIILIVGVMSFLTYKKLTYNNPNPGGDNPPDINENTTFDYNMIHLVNSTESNYLISPYSMAYALSILMDGANNKTRDQIKTALKNYNIPKTVNVQDRISIANALFIKNEYKDYISTNYINNMNTKYDAEIIFDDFNTPQVLNEWAYKKTYTMIDKVVDDLSKDFVLGIINAIAIDVEWMQKFEEGSTYKQAFTKIDNTTKDVDMMHTNEGITYISNNNAAGIVKDYKEYDGIKLEFIAILPNDKDIKSYINKFDENELNSLLSNPKYTTDYNIRVTLPKFKYDFDYKNFKEDLIKLGITDAFNSALADFSLIETEDSTLDLFVSEAVHKTHIDLSENGTKAAAITFFGLDKNAISIDPKEVIDIKFDRPFLYIIKEKDNNNIWFFGTVYEP